jgi:hypothetical protein
MAVRPAILCSCIAIVAASSPVLAQRWGRGGQPRDGVCFYKNPNFNGDYFCARTGESLSAVPKGMNDKISSIRIFGNAEVMVFRDVRFDGRSSRFDSDVRNLKEEGWNDLISSIRVQSAGGGLFGRRRPSVGRPGEDPERIVRRAYEDILNREPDSTGLRTYRSHILDDGWTEVQVREALRNSPEYRERRTMTSAKALEIVRRAYLAVLKREPDPGSQGFVDKVMRDHWSQQDVERELRKSPEYRSKGR